MKRLIYADHAATTKLDSDAFEAMRPFLLEVYGNPSQPYSFARKPKQAIKAARETIARCINALPEEIFFTSGGTESDNWAIKGVLSSFTDHRLFLHSAIEHHAVLNVATGLKKQIGYCNVASLPVDEDGVVKDEYLRHGLANENTLISVMLANNEIGTIQPIKHLCEIAHSYGALVHTDAVQAVGHIPVDVKELGVDLLSASAHKFNGPKGVGFLYIKQGTCIERHLAGGAQENGMRAGTENVAAIVAMAVALEKNCSAMSENIEYLRNLESVFFNELNNCSVSYIANGSRQAHLPGLISISFAGKDGEALLHRLDLMGISVSTGAACDSVRTQISHVLKAIGLPEEIAKGTIRISFGKDNTVEDAKGIAQALIKVFCKQ